MSSTSAPRDPSSDLNLNGMDYRNSSGPPQLQIKSNNTIPSNYHQIEDPIYGKVLIESQCAIEIINLPEFQRLRGVLQHGITGLIGLLPSPLVNRFDHSVGAMILVRHVGGSEEAQLAALLHDASHTALSHVADSVFGYVIHEVEKVDYLSRTQIPAILEKYGFDPSRVFNEELFPLLESPSPHLCADRLDYALRDSVSFKYLSLKDAQEIFKSTIAVEGRMVLNSVRAARLLGDAYLKCDQNVWADGYQAYMYKLAAQAIKLSLDDGLISKQTLWEYGDAEFWNLLNQNASPRVKSIIERINPRCSLMETKVPSIINDDNLKENPDDFVEFQSPDSLNSPPTLCRLKLRIRKIDPLVQVDDNSLLALTELDPDYRQIIIDYTLSRQSPINFFIRYIPQDTGNLGVIPAAAR